MAEEIDIKIKASIDSANAAQSLGQLKKSLIDLQTLADSGDLGAEQFKEVQKQIDLTSSKMADVTGKIGDIRDTVKTLDGSPVERLKNSVGLLGEGVRNLDFTKVIIGLKGVGAAIAANPIGFIATAVVALIAAFGDLDKIMGVITDAFSFALAPIQALFDSFGIGKNSVDAATQALDSYKSKLDEVNNTATVSNALLEAEIKILEAQGATFEQIAAKRKTLLNEQLQQTTEQQGITADYIDQLQFLQAEETKGSKEYVRLQGEINQAIKEVQGLKAKGVQLDAEIRASDIITQKKKDENAKKDLNTTKTVSESKKSIADRELRLLIEAEQAKIVVTEAGSTARWEAEKNAIDIIEQFQIKRAKDLEITENGITIIKANNIEKRKKLDEDYYSYTKKLQTIDIEEVKLKTNDDVRLNKMASDAITQIDSTTYQSKADKRKEEIRGLAEVATEAQKYAQMGAQVVTGIADLVFQHKKKNLEKGSAEEQKVAKKQFEFGRAVQLSLAIVDGFKAITTSLANSPIAFGPVPNPAGIASLAFAAATTAINIAKIAAMKFQPNPTPPSNNTPSPPSGGGGGPEPQTPTFQPTQFFGLGQTVAGLGGEQGGPTRVYVTEGDISNTQNRVRVVENRARFG
jgi:hypothetical protein